MSATMSRQPQSFIAGNVVAVEVLHGCVRSYREIFGSTSERRGEVDGASPSFVLAQGQLGHLSRAGRPPTAQQIEAVFGED